MRRIILAVVRVGVYAVAAVLILAVVALGALETGWGKNLLRGLIVRQANQYLTATLEIGRLEGSLLRGLILSDIRLSRDGRPIISADEVSLGYSIAELLSSGAVLREVRLTRPHIVVARQPDGRWNLAALLRRDTRQGPRSGPGRPVHILAIQILDGDVELVDPLTFGSVRVPSHFEKLNARAAFDYVPVETQVTITEASWLGGADPSIARLAGVIASGKDGWLFRDLGVRTSRSDFTLSGRVIRGAQPTTLDLDVNAQRLAFQEWSTILPGLKNIAVTTGPLTLQLKGPLANLATDIRVESDGGGIHSALVLDTSVPGWHGKGEARLDRLNLARWLNRPSWSSDLSGHVQFDLDLDLGGRFPRGSYVADLQHAALMGYQGDGLRARGTVTAEQMLTSGLTATAYGSDLLITSGSIDLDAPYRFHFQGTDRRLDLRLVPETVPVPRVESTLTFDYDVTGQFETPSITGTARLEESVFLGMRIGAGATGFIDTSVTPVRYTGEGDVSGLDLGRVGKGLDVAWMQDPRWAGVVAGHFHADGAGSEAASMALRGGGRLLRADLFGGRLTDADVTVNVADGSVDGSFDGAFSDVNPAVAFADARIAGSLTGSARARMSVHHLMLETPDMSDYDVDGTMDLQSSTVAGLVLDRAAISARLAGGAVDVARLEVSGPKIEGSGSGHVDVGAEGRSQFDYDITRADLSLAAERMGRAISGQIQTKGTMTGPVTALLFAGDATIRDLDAGTARALSVVGQYGITVPWDDPGRSAGQVTGRATFVEAMGREMPEVTGTVSYDDGRVQGTLALPEGTISGDLVLADDWHSAQLSQLAIATSRGGWNLAPTDRPPVVSWNEEGLAVTSLAFTDDMDSGQQLSVSGTVREDGRGALHLTANHLYLDTLVAGNEIPARYGGVIDLDAMISGTTERPVATGSLTITDGRVRRLSYEKLAGTVGYTNGLFQIDLRLDQAPGIWMTAAGSVPYSLADRTLPDAPMDVAIQSSTVSLGLLEGITDRVRNVAGTVEANLRVTGTSRDPHFTGRVAFAETGFLVPASGARYKNGSAEFDFATDRITVSSFHLEDRNGRPLTVSGSLGTHELALDALQIDVTARRFEVLNNETGSVDVDMQLKLSGRFETPKLEGDISILAGQLNIDEILASALFQPYSIQAATPVQPGAPVVPSPWDRLHLNVALHSRGTLRMAGQDVNVTQNNPLGLGSFNLRATGDLYLYKDPAQPLYINGSLDSVTGSYAFQGRRFDIDPTSSINFKGDLNPEIFVTVVRVISGVEARVTIAGSLNAPELRLASSPPLESSDILSLIVFNASTNELSAAQQRELAVRAGTLAYGFVATPLVSALQRSLGLDLLEIAPPDVLNSGPRLTIGNELAPGLVAQFTRQFGQEAYNEATIEYYLSRILRIRATFSNAETLIARSAFRRIERAGIDLLVFFSF